MNTTNRMYVCLMSLFFGNIQAIKYIYPVGSNSTHLYFIHQMNQEASELYTYCYHTKSIKHERYSFNQEMLYNFVVTNFELLPENQGYSFLDNGRLRIKYYHKPSPISVDFLYPIYDLHAVIWVEPNKGIICAKYKNCFGLFYFTPDGRVDPIVWTGCHDFLYPQVIDQEIYCIQKPIDQKGAAHIVSCKLPSTSCSVAWESLNFDEQVHILMRNPTNISHKKMPHYLNSIAFIKNGTYLSMVNQHHGFYLEQLSKSSDKLASFMYHEVVCTDGTWSSRVLFDFNIPRYLIDLSEKSLIEKMRLVLPIFIKNKIYFIHANTVYTTGIYSYNCDTSEIEPIWAENNRCFIGLLFYNNRLYFGHDADLSKDVPLNLFV